MSDYEIETEITNPLVLQGFMKLEQLYYVPTFNDFLESNLLRPWFITEKGLRAFENHKDPNYKFIMFDNLPSMSPGDVIESFGISFLVLNQAEDVDILCFKPMILNLKMYYRIYHL